MDPFVSKNEVSEDALILVSAGYVVTYCISTKVCLVYLVSRTIWEQKDCVLGSVQVSLVLLEGNGVVLAREEIGNFSFAFKRILKTKVTIELVFIFVFEIVVQVLDFSTLLGLVLVLEEVGHGEVRGVNSLGEVVTV